jgi:uncharacterized protein (TIGR03437 family)
VFILEGQTSAEFQVKATNSAQDEDVVLSAASDTDSSATSVSLRAIRPVALTCKPGYVEAGKNVICELQLNSPATSDSLEAALSSNSQSLRIPAQVGTRTGQSRLRFEATAGSDATQETAVIEARLANVTVHETLGILSPGVMSLSLPDHLVVQRGSAVHFAAVARDGQNLPLTTSISGQPLTADFNATTGFFNWLTAESDLGRHSITFTATNATGATVSKTVLIEVDEGRPAATNLKNGAGLAASPACSPGSVATLAGRFLSGRDFPDLEPASNAGDVPQTSVVVNGSSMPILFAAKDRVDFVCPVTAPGSSLDIAVETESGKSNHLRSQMEEITPGIFTADGSGTGQALAWRTGSSDLALIPSFRLQGKPALAGDKVSVLVTGVNCVESFGAGNLLLSLGDTHIPIDSVAASARKAGSCELGITIPEGIYGDAVPLTLDVRRSDGRIVSSNSASLAVGDKQ